MANYSIREFTASIDKWISQVESGLEDVVQELCKDVHKALVMGSPVDTGRFRGNWQITFNRIPLHAVNNYDKSGQRTIAEGNQIIEGMFARGAAITSVHFSNMLIYANALEYGHSKQAPSGVVGIVALRLRSYMTEAIRKSRLKNAL